MAGIVVDSITGQPLTGVKVSIYVSENPDISQHVTPAPTVDSPSPACRPASTSSSAAHSDIGRRAPINAATTSSESPSAPISIPRTSCSAWWRCPHRRHRHRRRRRAGSQRNVALYQRGTRPAASRRTRSRSRHRRPRPLSVQPPRARNVLRRGVGASLVRAVSQSRRACARLLRMPPASPRNARHSKSLIR